MAKRASSPSGPTEDRANKSRNSAKKGGKNVEGEDEGMGEFEDAWDDEFDADEAITEEHIMGSDTDSGAEDGEPMIDTTADADEEVDKDLAASMAEVYIPGKAAPLAEDEVLEADQTAYEMLHKLTTTWPCLSFDILSDPWGESRQNYPHEMMLVAGTQAAAVSGSVGQDEITIMRLQEMWKTQHDEDESDNDSDDGPDDSATLEFRTIPHQGGVNRVRSAPLSPSATSTTPYYTASMSDTGRVHIWNVRPFMTSLSEPGFTFDRTTATKAAHTITAHGRNEGFALDWSGLNSQLRLLTGNCAGTIQLTTGSASAWTTAGPFSGHTNSVEDIQWSPTEASVFASCSSDRSIRIWDTRVKGKKSVIALPNAHDEDVNVISWNKGSQNYLLASGGDEGHLKVWDMRSFQASAPSPVANFNWHTKSITSLEWHPTEDSVFAASGADDQVTIWDLSLEHDADEAGATEKKLDVPDQLLFVHQGQKDIKELHWHRQIPGALVTTALDGFNVFKTISV